MEEDHLNRYDNKFLWDLIRDFKDPGDSNPKLYEIQLEFGLYRTGYSICRGNELTQVYTAIESAKYKSLSKSEKKNYKRDGEAPWKFAALLWFKGHMTSTTPELPEIEFPFSKDRNEREAAKAARNANTKQVWIQDPEWRLKVYRVQLEVLKTQRDRLRAEKEQREADGDPFNEYEEEVKGAIKNDNELRTEAIALADSVDVPVHQRFKTCVEADSDRYDAWLTWLNSVGQDLIPYREVPEPTEEELNQGGDDDDNYSGPLNEDMFASSDSDSSDDDSDDDRGRRRGRRKSNGRKKSSGSRDSRGSAKKKKAKS